MTEFKVANIISEAELTGKTFPTSPAESAFIPLKLTNSNDMCTFEEIPLIPEQSFSNPVATTYTIKEPTISCTAECYIADKWGDNETVMRCQLLPGHKGWHQEMFRGGKCVLRWEKDEKPERDQMELRMRWWDFYEAFDGLVLAVDDDWGPASIMGSR